jgi:Ca2+-binding RTX toxin-like protein
VLLDASTAIRFNPAPGFVGAAPTLAVHLVDASAGTLVSGSVADLTTTGGNTPYSSGTVELSQEVLDGNSPPTAVSGMLAVDEFPSNGTVVGTVTGHDPDSAVLTYALVDDADGRFDINGTTGVVTVQDGLQIDYEQQAGHSIRVAVTDDQGESAEFDMAVAVQDVHGEIESGDARGNIMIGGAETDIFIGNTGSDMLSGGDGSDVLIGGTGILDFGNDGDALNGDGGIDVLYGGGGNDTLNGGAQADVLIGGNGNDVFVFQKGQANGDTVLDFFGAGSAAGDSVVLQDYEAGTSFTRVGGFGSNLYQINDHGFIEYVTIMGLGQVHASDVTFI